MGGARPPDILAENRSRKVRRILGLDFVTKTAQIIAETSKFATGTFDKLRLRSSIVIF